MYLIIKRAVLLAMFLLLSSCDKPAAHFQLQGKTMGTSYSIVLVASEQSFAGENLQALIGARLNEINRQMSTWRDDSELSRLNQLATGQWMALSPELYALLQQSLELNHFTQGRFDISIGPLVNLWGFGAGSLPAGNRVLPNDAEITRRLKNTGMHHLRWDKKRSAILKQRQLYLDLSAIAKGYAVDQIAEILLQQGYQHFLVEIGGEIKVQGKRADGSSWRIGIEMPESSQTQASQVLQVLNQAVATSGDYRNTILHDQQLLSHTIDPVSGRPLRHQLASVTVVHDSTAVADALATALMVMGQPLGLAFANQHNLAVFFIQRKPQQGWVYSQSNNLKKYLPGNLQGDLS